MRAAMAADVPPELPPGVLSTFHGFLVTPRKFENVQPVNLINVAPY